MFTFGQQREMSICRSCGSPVAAPAGRCQRCGTHLSNRTGSLIGATLADKYLIESRIGSGGMCDVYRARHILIDKEVAVKVLKPEFAIDPEIAQRFEQEACAASRVRHPNAIDVTDYGQGENNTPFIVMELVEGDTLGGLLRQQGPFTVERTANIIRQVCGALEVAHSVGVIHRDVKPDNIIIAGYDGDDWVEVADFGVAKIQEDVNRRAAVTGANFLIGTPRYMSPEQCQEGPVDARSDIYSLGVVAYEMLTGEAPFEGNSTRLLIAHATEPPEPLRRKRPDIPPEIEAVVMRALEKSPEQRQQSAQEFAQEFARAAGLSQEMNAYGHPSGAFSRVSVPPVEPGSTPQAASLDFHTEGTDEEETVVRRRAAAAPPEAGPTVETWEAGEPEAENVSGPTAPTPEPTTRDWPYVVYVAGSHNRGMAKRGWLIPGLAAGLVIAGLAAYLVLSRIQTPADPAPDQIAQEPPASAAPPPGASSPAPVKQGPPEEAAEEEAGVDTAEVRKEVTATILSWAESLKDRNLNTHVSHYAPTLHTYYLARGISRDFVRTDRARALSLYSTLDFGFKNIEVRVDPSAKRAVATYDKTWNFQGNRPSSGRVKERLWLEKAGGRWRITGERDLKVY